jgi:predicted TIM-barrel fold metal-dependent hydrolase
MVTAPTKTMVVDADSHFWEPPELWDRYLKPALRERVAASLARAGFDLHAGISEVRKAARQIRGGLDPVERLKWMDEEGIHATVIYPSEDTSASLIEEAEEAAAACRTWNEWAADFARHAPNRFKPCALFPVRFPDRVPAELRHAAALGLEVAFATPPPLGRPWSDPAWDPLWREMQDAGVVMTFHEFGRLGQGAIVRREYADLYPLRYLCGHTVELMLTLGDLILGGVTERFPRLQIGFAEGHIAWLPGWLQMMDDTLPRTANYLKEPTSAAGGFSLKPSEFFRRQMFVVGFPDDSWVAETVRHLGRDNLLMSTDYPHPQTRYHLLQKFDARNPGLPEDVRRKVLGANAARIFRLS